MNIDCHTSREWMTGYMAHGLSDGDTYAMERHLRGCSECAHEYRELKPMFHYLNASMEAPEEELTLSDARMKALLSASSEQAKPERIVSFSRIAQRAAVWGSMAASVILGTYLGMQSGQEKIHREEVTVEISSNTLNMAANTDPTPAASVNNVATFDFSRILPEYGIGVVRQRQDAPVINLVHPYYGLPGPRPQHLYSPGYAMDMHQ